MSNAKEPDASVRRKQSLEIMTLAWVNLIIIWFGIAPLHFLTHSQLVREHLGSWPQWGFWALFTAYVVAVYFYIRHFVFKNKAS